ncbi:MAG TPA: hypothetical protein PLL77_03400 [Pyrinomonadaceae bacterium]|nr:hypothetical protein [Pyrinomonadaceae bacterium]
MKIRILFLVFIIIAATGAAFAQSKTVTNDDLSKYKQERVKAEAELRNNYAKLGFPSPEERAARDAESVKQTVELSARLRNERLERERIDAQNAANAQYSAALLRAVQQQNTVEYSSQSYFGGYYNGWWRPRPIGRVGYQQPGYFAGGQFWPTGPATKPRPVWVPRH